MFEKPQSLYCDRHTIYKSPAEPSAREILEGTGPQSQVQRSCAELEIALIYAYSPQAKGRVERNHAVYQDRLVKMLRVENISTIAAANRYLQETFIPKLNEQFAKVPADSIDGHTPLTDLSVLDTILCTKAWRTVTNDYCISYNTSVYQIAKGTRPLPRVQSKVQVLELLTGEIQVFHDGHRIEIQHIQDSTQLHDMP